ncbi:hypothetical protein [Antarcticimicrobium luteum]|uniref:hypothetical protein n=1 Tax=Antarcticimicrobium luteum TaxID=2547397 RepID=UPI001409F2CB|nr:hypothetical protein [Antarcticimicrobium luteum]
MKQIAIKIEAEMGRTPLWCSTVGACGRLPDRVGYRMTVAGSETRGEGLFTMTGTESR